MAYRRAARGAPNRNRSKSTKLVRIYHAFVGSSASRHADCNYVRVAESAQVLYRFDRGIALGSCLYHLKKPFHVLETLANNARCCVLSTRVGARSVATTEIREEPIAYLLDNREANNDPARRRLKPMKGRCFPFAGNCATSGPDCQHLHGRSLAR
jgi:hypothetical protein